MIQRQKTQQKPLFVAEVSSNHHRNIERCFEFIDTAAEIGCGAVKFQLFRIDELFSLEARTHNPELEDRKAWELPVEFLPDLAKRCREKDILFSCTPFYLDAVKQLEPHVDFFKVASYELLWHDLLRACASTNKPMVLSTGMSTLAEIQDAVDIIEQCGCDDLTLLHCISGYPTPADACNLAALDVVRKTFKTKTGWSDHSVNPGVVSNAIFKWNATMIEFHLDLDGQGEEYATGHCWLPEEMARLIKDIESGLSSNGQGTKEPSPLEDSERLWRADPSDGLRPLKTTRQTILKESKD